LFLSLHNLQGADFDEDMMIELVRRGYSKKDIEKMWSGNFFRVMKAVEKGKTREVSLK
jgi:membrane dipeptidase